MKVLSDVDNALSASIQWHRPWWQPWRSLAEPIHLAIREGLSVHEALNAHAGASVRFVPQAAMPDGQAYEAFIFETRTVPTRDNLHDFFNGLAWLRFPRVKLQLNALQYAQISTHGVQAQRGAVRDALTLFDENAAFLCSSLHAEVISALLKRDWHAAFQTHRALLAEHPPLLFGHALMEKLVSPYKSITAHVFTAQYAIKNVAKASAFSDLHQLDALIAAQLKNQSWTPKPFVPLPVLGVPRWWQANESPDFYADREVFRPPRA